MSEHLQAGRDAWPEIEVTPERFAAEVARRGADGAALKAADLYVAIAACDGDERAIAAIRTTLANEVKFAAAKTTASADQLAEVTAILSRTLFVDEPERPAALRNYSGRGDLKSYLRVIATRELVRVVNKGRREVGIEDETLIDRLIPASDPELSILRAKYREVVDDAMRAALGTLSERERALLCYTFIDGMNVRQVGTIYNVHGATAARWLTAARAQLGERIREALAERLKIEVDEVDSIIRLVQSRIDVSLDRVLRDVP